MANIYAKDKETIEKQDKIIEIGHKYNISPYILDNFTNAELDELNKTIIKDPWFWYSKDKGFTVSIADKVAQHCEIPFDSRRDKAVFMASLESVIERGHCYARDFQLSYDLKNHNFPLEELDKVKDTLVETNKIWITQKGKIYPKRILFSERYLAQALVDLTYAGMAYFDDVCVSHPEFDLLAEEQRQAVRALEKSNLVILTGLPGTGKTRTVSVISQMYGEDNIVLCAPTGKAAKRITELCKIDARTLHSILFYTELYNYKLEGDGTLRNKLVIVDEASMMDIEIAGKLAIALDKTSCKLLIVGDTCQLPSVGPGEVLKQIVESKIGIHCHLTTIRRQQPGSIIKTAHAIANGKNIVKENDGEVSTIFYGNAKLDQTIKDIVNLKRWREVQFITVLKEYGSDIINPVIQNVVNPGKESFRENDKVIHLKNDKQNNVMNGDMGIVKKTYKGGEFLAEYSDQRLVYYTRKMQWMVNLAYAFTVHKSQGSEFESVAFLLNKSRITTRNLLYTGVTRAKRNLLIVAENEDIIFDAIDNIDKDRQSSLRAYIQHFRKEKENESI